MLQCWCWWGRHTPCCGGAGPGAMPDGPANCGVPLWWLCLMAAASWWLIGMASQIGSKRRPSCKASDTLCPRVPLVLAPRAAAQATTWWAIGHIATWNQAACARSAARGLTMTIVLFARKVARSSCVMVWGAKPWHTAGVLACWRCQWANGGALPAAPPRGFALGAQQWAKCGFPV